MTIRRIGLALAASLAVAGLSVSLAPAAMAQAPVADPKDVGTVEGMLNAWYDVLNGPPGAPRQWRRDSTLYTAEATFTAMSVREGKPHATTFTPESFRRAVNGDFVKNGFYETEIGHRIERFGNVAQVRSVYETRHTADGPIIARGVNYILMYWDGTRWWITGGAWDDERAGSKLPASWVHRNERVP
jgi:hypothetical protein